MLGLMVALHSDPAAAAPATPAAAAPAVAGAAGAAASAAATAAPAGDAEPGWLDGLYLPGPRVVAIAIMGLLAFGVLIGSLVSPAGQSLASSPILVSVAPQPAPAVTATTPVETPSDDTSSDDTSPAPAGHDRRGRAHPRAGRRRRGGPTAYRPRAPAGQARVPDRARGARLRGRVRRELPGPLPRQDADQQGRAADELLRGGAGRAGQRDRADQRPGPEPGTSRPTAPPFTRHRCRERSATSGQVAGERLRVSHTTRDHASRPADRPTATPGRPTSRASATVRPDRPKTCRHPAVGQRGPDFQAPVPGRRLRDLAQPVRLLPLADRRHVLRGATTSASTSSPPT